MIKPERFSYALEFRQKVLIDTLRVESGDSPLYFPLTEDIVKELKEHLETNTEIIDDLLMGEESK